MEAELKLQEANWVKSYAQHVPGPGNVWVRPDGDADTTQRILLCQFSSKFINPDEQEPKLYEGSRSGYCKLYDFWEIPQWMAFATYMLPNSDVYVVRDMEEFIVFLGKTKYRAVAFSSLDVTRECIGRVARECPPVNIVVGGYAGFREYFSAARCPNITCYDTLAQWAYDLGAPYRQGTDYRHFEGCRTIPRLSMSGGCTYHCTFCSVPREVTPTPAEVILQQIESFGVLEYGLVYISDKTFGQASNHRLLPHLRTTILGHNPGFLGFIVQTACPNLCAFTEDATWWAESGIQYVELGVETYNDDILLKYNKRQSCKKYTDAAVAALRRTGVRLVPNIIIGFPEEAWETYANTLAFLYRNRDIISHININRLAVYTGTDLARKLAPRRENDRNENVTVKSWHRNYTVVQDFETRVTRLANDLLDN